MFIYIIGRRPPPIGGVTVHADRLINWLAYIDGATVKYIGITPTDLLRFAIDCVRSRPKQAIVHCHTSSAWGLGIITLILLFSFSRAKLVYSLHSEYWVGDNLPSGRIRAWIVAFCLRRVALLIADNPRIASDVRPYVNRVEVIVPFLPPMGVLGNADLPDYLGLPGFDSPALVFNAYKLVYRDGRDVYGLDVMLNAYLKINIPLTLILLIPQLSLDQAEHIRAIVDDAQNAINRDRVHVVSRLDIEGWKVIAKANMFVRPTITDGDALSVREALYFGVPTIVSDCTTRPDGVVLFRTGDADDLAEKIMYAVGSQIAAPPSSVMNNPAMVFYSAYRELF